METTCFLVEEGDRGAVLLIEQRTVAGGPESDSAKNPESLSRGEHANHGQREEPRGKRAPAR